MQLAICNLRYAGVDWRNSSYHGCNRQRNPSGPLGNDGQDLSPLEVMFVPLPRVQPEHELDTAHSVLMAKLQVGGVVNGAAGCSCASHYVISCSSCPIHSSVRCMMELAVLLGRLAGLVPQPRDGPRCHHW